MCGAHHSFCRPVSACRGILSAREALKFAHAPDVAELEPAAGAAFALPAGCILLLQMWDPLFDDYVDMRQGSRAQHGAKVLISLKTTAADGVTPCVRVRPSDAAAVIGGAASPQPASHPRSSRRLPPPLSGRGRIGAAAVAAAGEGAASVPAGPATGMNKLPDGPRSYYLRPSQRLLVDNASVITPTPPLTTGGADYVSACVAASVATVEWPRRL